MYGSIDAVLASGDEILAGNDIGEWHLEAPGEAVVPPCSGLPHVPDGVRRASQPVVRTATMGVARSYEVLYGPVPVQYLAVHQHVVGGNSLSGC